MNDLFRVVCWVVNCGNVKDALEFVKIIYIANKFQTWQGENKIMYCVLYKNVIQCK